MSAYQEWLTAEGERWRQEQRYHRREEMNFGIQPEDLPEDDDGDDETNPDRGTGSEDAEMVCDAEEPGRPQVRSD